MPVPVSSIIIVSTTSFGRLLVAQLRGRGRDATMGTTAPVHAAYLRLDGAEIEGWYEVARGSGRMPEVVGIFLYPPEFFAGMREDGATEIRNPGDGAFLSPRTDIATVVVLEPGVAVIDARAGDQEDAKAIAELSLGKLKRP